MWPLNELLCRPIKTRHIWVCIPVCIRVCISVRAMCICVCIRSPTHHKRCSASSAQCIRIGSLAPPNCQSNSTPGQKYLAAPPPSTNTKSFDTWTFQEIALRSFCAPRNLCAFESCDFLSVRCWWQRALLFTQNCARDLVCKR